MYVGIREVNYIEHSHCVLKNMKWDKHKEPNYGDVLYNFIKEALNDTELEIGPLNNLLLFVLENVHDHGSGQCKLIFGKTGEKILIEVYEEEGGFDLKKLPNGIGGWGFRTIKRSSWIVSHSEDGRRTFIVSP